MPMRMCQGVERSPHISLTISFMASMSVDIFAGLVGLGWFGVGWIGSELFLSFFPVGWFCLWNWVAAEVVMVLCVILE
jgi:hypothetical protein